MEGFSWISQQIIPATDPQLEPELFSDEDAALIEHHIHVYSSQVLLSVININADVVDSDAHSSIHHSVSLMQQHHSSCLSQ